MHRDLPSRLHDVFPEGWQDDFAVLDEVVVAFVDVRADDVDVEEGLFDEVFHPLYACQWLIFREKDKSGTGHGRRVLGAERKDRGRDVVYIPSIS
jgi:hypothetical protein